MCIPNALALGNPKEDRVTPTVDLGRFARASEGEIEKAPTSNVRAPVSRSMVPQLVMSLDELRELPIDPRAAYLVSLVDGQCSLEMIADVAGTPADDVIEVFAMLVQLGAVELRDP
jgi:hypothetical protein